MNTETHQCNDQASQLVVVDIQQRLGAAMPAKVLNRVVQNTSILAVSAGVMAIPVLHTEQYPQGLGPTNSEVAKALPRGTVTFTKTSFSSCGAEGFMDALLANERKQVIIVGMEAHVCVLQTALDLQAHGFQVFVVEDAVCSRRLENYQNALDRMRQLAINLVSAESVVFEWLRDSQHEHFKSIQGLLR
jgi:nicotinamidase-related amidase